jgi:RNA polymerase sigma-70 factor (ECF subfamily)
VPDAAERPSRLAAVLGTVYLMFTDGHTSAAGPALSQPSLCAEAIRLGRLLAELMPAEPEVQGLLALMLLADSRRAARTSPDGGLVLLRDQDRRAWDRALIAEGQAIVRQCLRWNRPGPYQIQAAINAVHSDARSADATDWDQILQLYDQLLALTRTPIVRLHRAVALAEVRGADAALAELSAVDLPQHHLWHAIRADLLGRLGRHVDAAAAYDAALARAANAAERAFLTARRDEAFARVPAPPAGD